MSIPHSEDMDYFFQAVLTLENMEDCYKFFEDICTVKEMHDLVQRIQVARLLSEGKVYSEIEKKTGASSATISRVNKCLMYGAGGYREILGRMAGESHEE